MSMSPAQRGRFDPFPKAASPGWAGGAAARQPLEKQRKRERLLRPCWVRGAGSPLGRAAPAHSPRRQPREAFQASQCHAGLAFLFPKRCWTSRWASTGRNSDLAPGPEPRGQVGGSRDPLCVRPHCQAEGQCLGRTDQRGLGCPHPAAWQLPLPSRLAGAPRVRVPKQPALSECLFAIKQPKEE